MPVEGIFDRTRLLLGAEAMQKLAGSRVAVFGLGGVGGKITSKPAKHLVVWGRQY